MRIAARLSFVCVLLFCVIALTCGVSRADGLEVNATTWIAAETALEVNATTQVYSWTLLGPTDFTVVDTFSLCTVGLCNGVFQPTGAFITPIVSNGLSNGLLGNGLPEDGTITDAVIFLTGGETGRNGCSLSDLPPCELGVVNVYSATVDWGIGFNGRTDASGVSTTLLESFPTPEPTPEPGTLLLVGTGLLGLVRLRRRKARAL